MIRALGILAAVFFLVLPVGNAVGYELIFRFGFQNRYGVQTERLPVRPVRFPDESGNELAGFFYGEDNEPIEGLVVFAHGITSDHIAYQTLYERLTEEHFAVFAFDMRGYGASGKHGSGGLPEGIRSMRAAISYVKTQEAYREVPVIVSGHSFGAFAAGAALTADSGVDKAVLISPFNESVDMLRQGAETYIGPFVFLFLPYVKLYETLKFGSLSAISSAGALRESGVKSLVLFGEHDRTVRPQYGRKYFTDFFPDEGAVRIVTLPDSSHGIDSEMIETMLAFLKE